MNLSFNIWYSWTSDLFV